MLDYTNQTNQINESNQPELPLRESPFTHYE